MVGCREPVHGCKPHNVMSPASRPSNGRLGPLPGPTHAMTVASVVASLETDLTAGLDPTSASERLQAFGPNELAVQAPVSRLRLLLNQFINPVVYLLLAAIVASTLLWFVDGADGAPLDGLVIAAIIVLNTTVGFAQESRAGAAVAALRDLTRNEATVVRAGRPDRIPAADLVVGDLVMLSDGDVVPADARLVDVGGLRVAEAALTGESEAVWKSSDPVAVETPIGDRVGMVFSGTAVVSGRGRAVVTGTGTGTEIGRIATMLGETEQEQTPLQVEIDRVGRVLGMATLVIAIVVVATLVIVEGLRSAGELFDALLIGVSLAVAAVPEGLPAVLSVVLALGVQRMSRRNALVKRLVSVEALGSATIICSDKTGTLTRNEMMVRRVIVPSGRIELTGSGYEPEGTVVHDHDQTDRSTIDEEVRQTLIAGGLASDASLVVEPDGVRAVGDPTELALLAAQPKTGIDPSLAARRFERMAELPFTSERKRMSTVQADHDEGGRRLLLVKGAPDGLLERCQFERRANEPQPLGNERRRWWLGAVDELAGDSLRTLAIAYRPLEPNEAIDDPDSSDDAIEDNLVLLGVVGMIDPPRQEAKEAITSAHRAGIRVAMITGDHPGTAAQIATELGIAEPDQRVVTGADIEAASDLELIDLVARTSVYGRVAPEHKLRIVNALNAGGEVVAMTGDGVNDAPALKAANIGVAMGITGSDVSKEAADMILTDDDFATIVVAVNEGRAIFHNIRSFLRYLLSSNIGEVLTVFLGVVGASIIGLEAEGGDLATPLLAVQILWINLMTDAGPALALGLDPPLPDLMERRPRKRSDPVIDNRMWGGIAVVGLTMALATLAMLDLALPGGLYEGQGDLATARTGAFTVLVLAQLFNTFNARSDTESVWGRIFINPWLHAAIAVSLLLQLAVVYLPFLNEAFGTVPLSLGDWLVATGLAAMVLPVAEIRKLVLRRRTPQAELD